ncbi:hypothetical protein EAX61_08355 [Dokdonia sinensis]|uniref:Outer membrane protein beta-barrel domain-containing protein n=1 Tax=Dokdonia sinensis TaxID=2479847 RepID=A0A3M0GP63_9FLAO|nr:hypothetical protein [Dokdonia sinensis]RMB59066.1 hypothetical protein EAX61_08355 [Dokdonia sinensis]
MKRLLLTLCVALCCFTVATAQTQSYTINGNSYELQTEVEGPLTLLWNVIAQEYRYFIKKDDVVTELTNTEKNGDYQQEYKAQLQNATAGVAMNTNRLNLTLASLRKFVNDYNKKVDPTYQDNSFLTNLEYRLGAFGGVTNNIFTFNPNNESTPQFGIDFELYDAIALPSHSVVFQYKQTLSTDEFDYSSSQFSINHRLKFIKSNTIDVFLNTKLITVTNAQRDTEVIVTDENMTEVTLDDEGTSLQAPIIFGLGADIKVGPGFITVNYHDAVSIFNKSNDEFPVDVSAGYKIRL